MADQVKGVGSGDAATIVDYEEFNKGEVAEYRATLDDIAKELGHRVTKQEISGADGGPITTKHIKPSDADLISAAKEVIALRAGDASEADQ